MRNEAKKVKTAPEKRKLFPHFIFHFLFFTSFIAGLACCCSELKADCHTVDAGSTKGLSVSYSEISDTLTGESNTYTDSQGLIFTLNEDGTCIVSGHAGENPEKICIPSEITLFGRSYRICSVGSRAIADCSELVIANTISEFAEDAFSNCISLEKIRIIPSQWSTERSGKKALVSMNVYSWGLPEYVRTEVIISEDFIKKAVSYKNVDEIRISFKIKADLIEESTEQEDPSKKEGEDSGERFPEITCGKKAAKILRKHKKDVTLCLVNSQGIAYLMKLRGREFKKSEGISSLLVNEITESEDYGVADEDIKKALKKNGIRKENIRVIRYSTQAEEKPSIEVAVPSKKGGFSAGGKECYAYYYLSDEGKFVQAGIELSLKVSSDRIEFPMYKKGIYIVTKKPLKYMVKKQSDEFVRDGGDTYYVNKKCEIFHGWMRRGKNYYYFDRKNGKMAEDTQVDGIELRPDGTAKKTDYAVAKINVMIKARKIVEEITKPSDTKAEKMKKSFLWVFPYPYRRFRRLNTMYNEKGWEITFANDIFDRKMGCCVSDAAAVAFLFKECGCEEVYIGSDTGHAWVEYNGRVYDPLFAEARGFSRYYNVSYESARTRAIVKRQI